MSNNKQDKSATKDNKTFEQAYKHLESIVEQLNEDSLPLNKVVTLCEEANYYIQFCYQELTNAEQKVEILLKSTEGNIISEKHQVRKDEF